MNFKMVAGMGLISMLSLGGCSSADLSDKHDFNGLDGQDVDDEALLSQPRGDAPVASGNLAEPRMLDDRFAAVAQIAPAFAGMYTDADEEHLYVRLTDMSQVGEVERAIAAVFGDDQILNAGIHALPADYSFIALKRWYESGVRGALAMDGVSYTDINEAENRISIGVTSHDARRAVEAELDRLGVPREAVLIVDAKQLRELASLQDTVRPLRGGLRITTNTGICTLGFSAYRDGLLGFVTNSHCTNKRGSVEYTPFYQNESSYVGEEIADPPHFTGDECPANQKCRYSDSAFVELEDTAAIGAIANVDPGSLQMVGKYWIAQKVSAPLMGAVLEKVGQTSGRTSGAVTHTCVDTGVASTNITMLCQYFFEAQSQGGDSGSPIFKVINGTTDVKLYGVLWGGGSTSAFSAMENIQDELGGLKVVF